MAYLNSCEFIGVLLTEIDLKYTGSGVPYAKALLWVRKDSQTGRRYPLRLWIHAWGKLAEAWYEWQRRKDWVFVAGELRIDFKHGHHKPYLRASTIQFLYPRPTANVKGGHYLMPKDMVDRFMRFQKATDELQAPDDAFSMWEINKITPDDLNPDDPMRQHREDMTDQTVDEHVASGDDYRIDRDVKRANGRVRPLSPYLNINNMAGLEDDADEPERDPGQ